MLEVDRLKSVLRRGRLADGSRHENSAEHSWTLALMAMVLAEHAAEPVDVGTVVRMVVVHDIVEVDAGDTYVYDEAGRADKAAREQQAADRIFALLPPTRPPRCGRCGTSSRTAGRPRHASPDRWTGSPASCSTTPAGAAPGGRTA